MLKRILTIACGIALGMFLGGLLIKLAVNHGLLGSRELNTSSNYVRSVMSLVGKNYYDGKKIAPEDLARNALHGMIESLDPHSEFMEAKNYKELEEDIGSEFGGVGLQIELRNGRVYIVTPVAGSPGDLAGLRRGDEITNIDSTLLDRTKIETVVEKLRGKPDTTVVVGIKRTSDKREFSVTLTRKMIKTQSVSNVRMLGNGVGYMLITQFTERTGEEYVAALNQLADMKASSLIIDLRNNPGGVLEAAVEVAEPFFKKGELIVYTQGRAAKDREEFRAETDDKPIDIPVAVLINMNSASAAEIVAGALKDTGHAVIVGERSFGKGSVQTIFDLKNGEGLRLTTARYYTPGGETIHEHGVTPHIEVVLTQEEDENVSLQLARPELATDASAFKERFETDLLPDRQLQAAATILQALQTLGRWTPNNTADNDNAANDHPPSSAAALSAAPTPAPAGNH